MALRRDDAADVTSESERLLLEAYHHSFDDARVNLDLVLGLLHCIHSGKREGQSK